MTIKNLTIFLLSAYLSNNILCWHSTGHLTVARIAELYLPQIPNGQKALEWSIGILLPFTKLCGEDKYPFTECATWPDKLKAQGYWMMAGWHFSDSYYYKPGYIPPAEKKQVYQNQNIAWSIKNCSGNLISTNKDPEGKSDPLLMKTISMRNLIHFIGDIHQPLHTTSRYSAEFPDGDMGGNLFPINHYSDPTWNNLHFIWDHMFDMGREIASPLTQEEYQWLTGWSQDIMDIWPYVKLQDQITKNWNADLWVQEGFEISSTFVYEGLKENEDPSQDYQLEAKRIVKRQLALGGYRLANQIVYIYNKHMDPSKREKQENDTLVH